MADAKQAEKLLSALKKHEPFRVRAYAGDDDSRDIAVPQRRRRWGAVIEAIDARPWSRVEFLDKSGCVLGYCDNTSPAGDLEDVSDSRTLKMRSDAEWAVQLALKTGRELLAFRDAETTALLKAQGDVVRELTSAMRGLAEIYGEQRDAAADVASMRAEADNGGDVVKQLIEAGPVLLQALPALKELLNGKGKH